MATEEAGQWHGWAFGEDALFVTPSNDSDHIGLYVQQGRVTELAAVFIDPAMAQLFMDWMDSSLSATGEANNTLLTRLQSEQPLLFAPPAAPASEDEEEEADGE